MIFIHKTPKAQHFRKKNYVHINVYLKYQGIVFLLMTGKYQTDFMSRVNLEFYSPKVFYLIDITSLGDK